MGRRKSPTFTEVELEFMRVIWPAGKVTTEDVRAALRKLGRDLSDGSIRKILSILIRKGHLTRRREGRGFLYKPVVRQGQANRRMVQDLKTRAFGGSTALMVAALFDGKAISGRDLEDIKRLIAEHERKEDQ
ncbi:MAG: BlaI/MecI/CopY family transcriptional regulator [Acidobacteria bacterium]|nr:MAG: BlaI/MecI/CopY family transcriptional regulator [Acidobacteriota bacterium]